MKAWLYLNSSFNIPFSEFGFILHDSALLNQLARELISSSVENVLWLTFIVFV